MSLPWALNWSQELWGDFHKYEDPQGAELRLLCRALQESGAKDGFGGMVVWSTRLSLLHPWQLAGRASGSHV